MNRSVPTILSSIFMATMFATGLAAGPSRPAAAAEEATIQAFSVWQGQGTVIQTGPNEATFVGAISGTVYVETEKGPVDSGQMFCPAMIRINLEDGSQSGTGRCTLIGEDEARVFADVSCTGVHLVGCTGEFTLTGGAGRFAGITGGGPVTLRGGFHEIVSPSGPAVQEAATGIIFWPALHYKIP